MFIFQDLQNPTNGSYIWKVEDFVSMRITVWSEVVLSWAHQHFGKNPLVLKDFYQIIVMRIHTFVAGQWFTFFTVMELSILAMCKDS